MTVKELFSTFREYDQVKFIFKDVRASGVCYSLKSITESNFIDRSVLSWTVYNDVYYSTLCVEVYLKDK